MDQSIEISAGDSDEVRSLHSWLGQEPELLCRLRLEDRDPQPGDLGGMLDTIIALAAPGGVAVALTTGVMTWLQPRQNSIRVKMVRPDGSSMEVEAGAVSSLSAAQLDALIERTARWAEGGDE
jgi:hypothetical protein